jgi:predicted GIY-YIG superfamily endonuclease
MQNFYVYMLKCSDGSYYTGHTDSIDPRISAHAIGEGCGYTSTRLPVKVVFVQEFAERSEALEAEMNIKKWSRKKK